MAYPLDLTKAHRQSFIELVNHDNAGTIGNPLELKDVLLKGERKVDREAEGIERDHAITLENAEYAPDTVEVYFNKIKLQDVVDMVISEDPGLNDFNWYQPDEWVAESPAQAIEALKAAAQRAGVAIDATTDNIAVERFMDDVDNHYYLRFTFGSLVFKNEATFRLPRFFSEEVSVTALDGFNFSPIQPEDVVF